MTAKTQLDVFFVSYEIIIKMISILTSKINVPGNDRTELNWEHNKIMKLDSKHS